MAQAARQSLRMQKELKILITDPPHGASFPSLSDGSSLTSIDAHFKGPEGTVYANGVFKIKIQIPERYPFQPPMVTFATPIYHPNIDTGGRICLDILNLPPKGSWQPSLNISTVLTSIGLLLSEPNPDDGLMHDASREYKYNRQVFDQKARSMTDKYARAGESGSSIGSQDSQTQMCPSISKAESEGPETSKCVTGSSRKLSLEYLGSSSKQDNSEQRSKLPNDTYIKSAQHEEAKPIATEFYRNQNKQEASKHKLSLRAPAVSCTRNRESTKTNMPSHCTSISKTENSSKEAPDTLPLAQAGLSNGQVSHKNEDLTGKNHNCTSFNEDKRSVESVKTSQGSRHAEKLQPALSTLPNEVITSHMETKSCKDVSDRSQSGSDSTNVGLKTGVAVGLKTSFGPIRRPATLDNEKENMAPSQPSRLRLSRQTISERKPVSENGKCSNGRTKKQVLSVVQKSLDEFMGSKSNNLQHLEKPNNDHFEVLKTMNDAQLDVKQRIHKVHCEFKQHSAGSPEPEEMIVLDSEDSEDENVPARSRLLLARKRLALKRKRIT